MAQQPFKSLENIQTAFSMVRTTVLVVVVLSFLFAGGVGWWAFQTIEQSRQRVYVLENGKSLLMALSKDQNVNRPAEARNHLQMFHHLFFAQEPNEKAIEKNMMAAALLGDNSITRLYKDLKEKQFFSQLISGNVIEKYEDQNIDVDFSQSPYRAIVYGKQTFIRASTISVRKLVTECYLIDTRRTDENPHGFLIERLRVLDNREIENYSRDLGVSKVDTLQ